MSRSQMLASPTEVVRFWSDAGADRWFRKDEAFDREFRDRFLPAHAAAAHGELLDDWRRTAEGSLGLLVLLDQFPRNAFRGSARMYATDALARLVAQQAVEAGQRGQVAQAMQGFFHLPFSHSEWLPDQVRAVELARTLDPESERWAIHHHDVVARFGRFPHRNALLGRNSTAAERAFLAEGGFAG
ncbi:DUF924 family protein [Ramlibacter henchirensis]|uniref:DUF924 family protein n=1 Tax=Ramlibacter henchirensis TaxID=204072 RepID=A0A4Z0BML0_9BURK|nr:DUF924 family protein [Ramlibacter henchirensis]TFY99178.1 DUF924 family protein [Ramlibacter henchirensis]